MKDLSVQSGVFTSFFGTYGPLYTFAAGGVAYSYISFPWESLSFSFKKSADTSLLFMVACSVTGSFSAAGQDGYALRVNADESIDFCVVRNGVLSVIYSTAAAVIVASVEYKFRVSYDRGERRFRVYVSGGSYLTETPLVSVVDATFDSLFYFVAVPGAGDAV